VRHLVPPDGDRSLDDLYTDLAFPDPPATRPHVYLDMVASVDGAATSDGRTAALGGEADRVAFSRLREWCDAVLIGASTARVEGYGPPRPRPDSRQRRRSRGLAEVPRLVVVTASAALDPGARLFGDPTRRPLVVHPRGADPVRTAALREVADLLSVGEERVDLGEALGQLRRDGVGRLLCEGGPALNAELLAGGLVDEIFLTVAPQLVGESRHRIVEGPLPNGPCQLVLRELREHEGELLLRYGVTPRR
jgi:riboflavin biosynthesis pyrimidine reductase